MYYPSATYRVQLNSSYTLSHLQNIVDYLEKLGVSTIYAAPITTSMKGSTHGYDVRNPDVLNKEIGTVQQLEELSKTLLQKGMGWLQDIVPNHMAFLCSNERIADVMERGDQSPYYRYFDIDWNHYDPVYKGKLMVPFIGKDVNEAIEDGEVQLTFDEEGFHLSYFNERYPVAIDSLPFIFLLFDNEKTGGKTEALLNNNVEKEKWKSIKKQWLNSIRSNTEEIEKAIGKINRDKALLREFINQQHYILTWYKVTESEINFRRFFTINQLLCLRMEDEFVFTDYHQFILRLYNKGLVQGLRIDHIDGLYHPQQYIERLRKMFGDNCYVIAEKILEYNEDIARDWNLQGTSGYEFLSFTSQLLTDRKGAEKLFEFYKELVPQTPAYEDMVFDKKHNFLYTQMGGELENLLHLSEDLKLFAQHSYESEKLKQALGILMASFPVYRIYPDQYPLHEEALPIVKKAFARAEEKIGNASYELSLLKTVFDADGSEAADASKLLFLMRLMQFTGPLAAKGVEDTTFYVYNPLISHNEVGDSPSQLGITVDEFHQKMQSRQQNNPYSLNATSTHDTKRGEDGRMRINALAAMPGEWIQNVNGWRQMNTPFIKTVNDKPAPSANDEYFIYQSLIGAFPEDGQVTDAFVNRTYAFLEKALREAKVETTYNEPNAEYEEACKNFITSILDAQHSFLQSFVPFLQKIIEVATLYSLAQTVIKITAPGIPDIYQGCELWDLSYVDPDNRRPVDYDCRKHYLDEMLEMEKVGTDALLSFIHQHKKEGREKLYVTYKTLNLRLTYNDVFLEGEYLPLTTHHDKLLAYARRKGEQWILVVIPFTEAIVWDNSELNITLPQGTPKQWTNIFTNEKVMADNTLPVTQTLQKFPLAVLVNAMDK